MTEFLTAWSNRPLPTALRRPRYFRPRRLRRSRYPRVCFLGGALMYRRLGINFATCATRRPVQCYAFSFGLLPRKSQAVPALRLGQTPTGHGKIRKSSNVASGRDGAPHSCTFASNEPMVIVWDRAGLRHMTDRMIARHDLGLPTATSITP